MTSNIFTKKYKKELTRKLLHLSSLWIPLFIYFFSKELCIITFSILLSANITFEYLNYKRVSLARKYLGFIMSKLCRNFELNKSKIRFSGSVFVLAAALLAVMFFTKPIAITAITVMLVADTAAALLGSAFGSIKICGNKSLEGSLAFFITAIISCMLLDNLIPFGYSIVIACFVATILEVYSKKIKVDDNLSITMSLGIILSLV